MGEGMKNAVVLVSGGMDSAVVLAIARERGFRPHALSVSYGQRHTSELAAAADGLCVGAFEEYVGVPYLDSPLQFTYLFPSLGSWQELDDRTVVCILVSSQPVTGPMGSGPGA